MKERPIIFSGPMVRAILDGRKTQTRRAVKPQPLWVASPGVPFKTMDADPKGTINCPYGQPGDRLWVRESHYMILQTHDGGAGAVEYRADYCDELASGIRWRPSIHMPRSASRITLEVVSVRVERLDEISEEDAKAEGYKSQSIMENPDAGRLWFRDLWESINGPGSWAKNPFVWVVEFKRVEGGGK